MVLEKIAAGAAAHAAAAKTWPMAKELKPRPLSRSLFIMSGLLAWTGF
jgi:hypothetical protein